jgi:hypothetical protein
MRTIELFGENYCIRFDTDKAPATVDANGKPLKPRDIKRRGVSCTIYKGDAFEEANKVAFSRAECNHRDVFNGTIGEKRSFGQAVDMLIKKLLKPIKARLENEVLSTNIGKRLAEKKAREVNAPVSMASLATPKLDGANPVALSKSLSTVRKGSTSRRAKAPAKP